MESKQTYKPLAPKVPKTNENQAPGPYFNAYRDTRVSTACSSCRSRQIKCDGVAPCGNCRKFQAECIIDENSDNRRNATLKRKFDSLENDRELLIQLMESFRNSDDNRVHALLNLIRSNAPLFELKSYIDNQLNRESSPKLAVVGEEIRRLQQAKPRAHRNVMDVRRLCDQAVYRVPAKPWTTVTDDDEFVSHLISLYFTWYHPCFPWIDREIFLRDMKAGNADSEFCSPFLVNSLLADACAYSDYAEAYADSEDLSTRGAHFFAEAKRCLEEEEGRFTVATVQGLEVLSVCAFLMGKDRRGWVYQGQLAFAAKELARSTHSAPSNATAKSPDLAQATNFTFWGLYVITMASAMAYHKPSLVEKPDRPCPHVAHDHHKDLWYPYPAQSDGYSTHPLCHFNNLCELTIVINNWCQFLFGDSDKPAFDRVKELTESVDRRLSEWQQGLPPCLDLNIEGALLPQVLCLHMYYHNIVITIFGFAKNAENEDDETGRSSAFHKYAADRCLRSAREISNLMKLHRSFWGLDIFPAGHIQWITVSLFTLLEGRDDPANREAFTNLSIAAKTASRRWTLGKGMLRAVQVTAGKMAVSMPPETDLLFADFEQQIRNSKDREGLNSLYPNFAVSTGSIQTDEVELDKFLEKWDALGVSESNEPDV